MRIKRFAIFVAIFVLVCLILTIKRSTSISSTYDTVDGNGTRADHQLPPRELRPVRRMAAVDDTRSDPAYVFVHVPKSGGTWANNELPGLLNVSSLCANKWWSDAAGARRELADTLGDRCHFLTHETPWPAYRSWMSANPRFQRDPVRVLTMVREPTALWLSAGKHMRGKKEDVTLRHHKRIQRLAASFDNMIKQIQHGSVFMYDLRRFPLRFYGADLDDAVHALRNEFWWFGVFEHMELSIALLLCQLNGFASSEHLKSARNRHNTASAHVTASTKSIDALHRMNPNATSLYNIAVTEFWSRVAKHKKCVQASGAKGAVFA